MRPSKPAAIVNPRAGRGRALRVWNQERRRLEERFGCLDPVFTEGPGEASILARRLCDAGCDLLVIVGGDGTVNEAANGLLGGSGPASAVTLVPVAGGNGSDLAGALEPGDAPCLIDAVRAVFHDSRGALQERWFVNMASFGLGADVVHGERGRAGYLFSAAVALLGSRTSPVRLDVGGTVVEAPAIHVALGNGPAQGGGMRICPLARLDDGLLDVTLIGDVTLLDLAANLRLIYSGRIHEHPRVRHFRAAWVRAEGPCRLELDGDPAGFLPAVFQVEGGVLRVLPARGNRTD